jgi:hypothetical protein
MDIRKRDWLLIAAGVSTPKVNDERWISRSEN